MTKFVAVVSGKGGTAKTSTSIGLAATWAAQGVQVLLVDTDQQDAGSASWWLGRSDNDDDQFSYLKATGHDLAGNAATIDEDLVVIDTAPRLDDEHLEAVLKVADLAVVVSPPAPLDIAAAAQTIVSAVQPSNTPYIVAMTMVQTRSLAEAHTARAELLKLGHPVAGAFIRYYAPVRRAGIDGQLPTQLAGSSGRNHSDDLEALVAELAMTMEKPNG